MKYKDYYNHLTENSDNISIYINALVSRALKKYEYADKQEVYSYCLVNSGGVNLKKLEDDAKLKRWDPDTIRAIYYVLSRVKNHDV